MKVVMSVRAKDTLGFGSGLVIHPEPIRSIILVDARASSEQQQALAAFARERAGEVAGEVVRIAAATIDLSIDHVDMTASSRPARKSRSRRGNWKKGIASARTNQGFTRR